MKYCQTDISIPKWISERSYFVGMENSRTYISNEKYHTYIQLDGLSSDFWFYLTHCPYEEFYFWADSVNLLQAADSFLEQLSDQGLVILHGYHAYNESSNGLNNAETDRNEKNKFIVERSQWLWENHFLAGIFFELTYKCNLKCVHCYNPKDMSSIEIPIEKAKEIIDEAYELGCYSVTISGGESTIYTNFLELIDYIRSKKLSLEIFTNGQVLSDNTQLYEHIKAIYPHRICLSLYSTDMNAHDYVTDVDGSYTKTMSVIKKLRKDHINVQIKNFLLNTNCESCINVKKLAEELHADCVADLSLIPTIQGDKSTFQYVIDEDKLFELFVNPESPLFIGKEPTLFDINENRSMSPCFGGFGSLCISPTLDVNVCVSLPMPVGNLSSLSIKDLWQDAIHHNPNSKLYKWQSITNADLTECYQEDYCKFCHYCAGMGYLENGFLKKSDILCSQARAKKRAYEYLNEVK